MKRDQIGVQLYTLREMAQKDLDETLKLIARLGFAGVEFAGFYGHTAEEVKGMLDHYGLKAFSAHIQAAAFEGDIESVVNDLQTIGAEWGIVPWVSPENRDETSMRDLGAQMNAWASRLKDAGLKFAYHNHDFEFTTVLPTGETLFHTLVNITDPETVFFELDAGWVYAGGYDPAKEIREHPDRIRLLHLKDADGVGSARDTVLGQGKVDWNDVIAAARETGIETFIVEMDNPNPDDPAADVEASLRFAEGLASA
jgi:sugar phosphate isomerase/epimerase